MAPWVQVPPAPLREFSEVHAALVPVSGHFVVLGFILGPLLEDNFRQALLLGQGDWTIFVRSGICWFFWGLTASTIGLLIYRRRTGAIPQEEGS